MIRGKLIHKYPTGKYSTSSLEVEELENVYHPFAVFWQEGSRFEQLGVFNLDQLKVIQEGLLEFITEQDKKNILTSKHHFVRDYQDLCKKYKLMIETDGEARVVATRIGQFLEPSLKLESPR